MNAPNPGYIVTGKVGAVYGIKGWLKIQSYTEIASHILHYRPWYLAEGPDWQVFELEASRQHGKSLVVKFSGIDTPEVARKLTDKLIAIKREQLVPLPANEYYWADLEGLTVIDQTGQVRGEVIYLIATGSNDVLVIRGPQGKEQAIPYLPGSVVKKVDLKERKIFIDWDFN